ncbi:SDR family oxidoreductase [Azospirillum sp. B21]|uniref:SDR family NAD(P)-dependent oxidoreductase n=1 Tax=Azospirillum sp. B21 TaxID=2607496 RepID=UPI0011EFFD56|nr:SDR family oxidoreductase [Azospirillum sp. B21]KAA0578300.1 SDR family oxidoreductase [Azospirillum sp. B21]
MRLSRAFAVVTGGSDGIGYAIAQAFAREGADLCLVARNADRLADAAARLARSGIQVTTVAADLGHPVGLERVAAEIAGLGRAVDVLVNNAGTATFVPYLEADRAQYDHSIALNVTAPFFLTQALVPLMPAARGSVINISSYFSGKMLPGRPSSLYSLTKGALNSLTKAMAYELAPRGIRVNAIAPGTVDTDLRRRTIAAMPEDAQRAMEELVKRLYPLGRIGQASDLGGIAVFLASSEAAWTTGAIFAIDGGLTIT